MINEQSIVIEVKKVLSEQGIKTLPIDPFQVAKNFGIRVTQIPKEYSGVSGIFMKFGEDYLIAYNTCFNNEGFERFSIAHELGHYRLLGHPYAVLDQDGQHKSKAGFFANDRYEREADTFAANLLMPKSLFTNAINMIEEEEYGLTVIEKLAEQCRCSYTATSIQYAKYTDTPVAVIVSRNSQIDYCFMSNSLKNIAKPPWPKKKSPIPKNSTTYLFNTGKIKDDRIEDTGEFQDWFDGNHNVDMLEQVVKLGSYGRTLTVLSIFESMDQEELDAEDDLKRSWQPHF